MANQRRKKRDYYQVLGVPRDADDTEIKRAFRDLARRYHPDISKEPDAEDRFKEINEAYAVLSDDSGRKRYDRFGFAGVGQGDHAGQGFGAVVDAVDDLIGDFLRRKKGKKRGRDMRYTLELTLEEAAFGCEKSIKVPLGDDGKVGEYTVTVPAGSKDGAVRRLKGEGEVGREGGSRGDLNVILRVRPHPFFEREGSDVWCEVPISFPQAALGDVIEVPTLKGKVNMRIPEGTQSGRVFRMKGKGIAKSSRGVAGDQMVRIIIETPSSLTSKQRELLETFAKETGNAIVQPQARGFIDTLKEFFKD